MSKGGSAASRRAPGYPPWRGGRRGEPSRFHEDAKGTPLVAQKMLVFCGSDDPDKVFPPFMLGCGAQALDLELTLFFTLTGLNVIKKGGAEGIELPGAPNTLPGFLQVAKENGARLIACSAAFPIVGAQEDDFIDGVEFGGVAEFVSLAAEADVVLTFC